MALNPLPTLCENINHRLCCVFRDVCVTVQGCANATSCVLLSSSRNTEEASTWSDVVPTNIPDLGSNLNAGSLSDGRVFLVWNGVPRPHVNDSSDCGGGPTVLRNPLTLALASDGGVTFDRVFAL